MDKIDIKLKKTRILQYIAIFAFEICKDMAVRRYIHKQQNPVPGVPYWCKGK